MTTNSSLCKKSSQSSGTLDHKLFSWCVIS